MHTPAHYNDLGQPIGFPVPDWHARSKPQGQTLKGQYCTLEALALNHASDLLTAYQADQAHRIWTYLPYGPFDTLADFQVWLTKQVGSQDPLFYCILDKQGKARGVASYLRIDANHGVIEVGHINYSPALQKTVAATEAMYLLMRHIFDDLGYRRYEWKCDALNAPSRQAAERLGFTFEGIFRQALMYKGRNRDTAWYSILDTEWPALKLKFEKWLDPKNFTRNGQQILTLQAC